MAKQSRGSLFRRLKRKIKGQPDIDYDEDTMDDVKKKIKRYRFMKGQSEYAYAKPDNQYEFVTVMNHKVV